MFPASFARELELVTKPVVYDDNDLVNVGGEIASLGLILGSDGLEAKPQDFYGEFVGWLVSHVFNSPNGQPYDASLRHSSNFSVRVFFPVNGIFGSDVQPFTKIHRDLGETSQVSEKRQ